MADMNMMFIPNGRYTMEMRSGKLLKIDEGFTSLVGYTKEEVEAGVVFKQLVPDVEYNEIIDDIREKFIDSRYVCYQHEMVTKSGNHIEVVSFINIQNKLLEGHRVLEVGVAEITNYMEKN